MSSFPGNEPKWFLTHNRDDLMADGENLRYTAVDMLTFAIACNDGSAEYPTLIKSIPKPRLDPMVMLRLATTVWNESFLVHEDILPLLMAAQPTLYIDYKVAVQWPGLRVDIQHFPMGKQHRGDEFDENYLRDYLHWQRVDLLK